MEDFLTGLEHPRARTALLRDITYVRTTVILTTNDGFDRSTVPNWDRTGRGNAIEHRNRTELEPMHDTVAVECGIIKILNADDGMGTYKRSGQVGYCIAKPKSANREGGKNPLLGDAGQYRKPDRACMGFGRPDGRKIKGRH